MEQSTLPELYRGFVRTSCSSSNLIEQNGDFLAGLCVGKLIPAIAEKFENSTTKFILLPHNLPVVRFVDGLSTMDLNCKCLEN